MVRLTDFSESNDSIIITDKHKRNTSISLNSIRSIELNEQSRLGFNGIVWDEMNQLLRNFMLVSGGCLMLFPFLVPMNEMLFWLMLYGGVIVLCFVFLLSSTRMGQSITLICSSGNYTVEIEKDKHWQILYSRYKPQFPLLQNPPAPILITPKPRYLMGSLIYTIVVLGLISWSYENLSVSGSALLSFFGCISSYWFLKLSFQSGCTKVSFEENQLVFFENRGRYKKSRHTIDFNRIDRFSMNANHLVTIHRRTQKELAAETGLENFNHYNRIDYHFLRKNYSLLPYKQGILHRLQLEAMNEQIRHIGN